MPASQPPKRSKPPQNLPIAKADIRARAYELWRSRSTYSTAEEDWNEAKRQLEKEQSAKLKGLRKVDFWLNQPIYPFLYIEKRVWEPLTDLIERSALFQIAEKVSPVAEMIGVLLIPFVVWWATQSYQEHKDALCDD